MRVLVLVWVARRTLDPWVRCPHQALLVLHQLQDVFLRADMIDFAQLRIILDEGLPLLAVERPIDRLGKDADPVPAEMPVGFLAREQQQLVVRSARGFRLHSLAQSQQAAGPIERLPPAETPGEMDAIPPPLPHPLPPPPPPP